MLVQLTGSAGWWLGDDDSHGVEISIAGGVVEMVRVLVYCTVKQPFVFRYLVIGQDTLPLTLAHFYIATG